MSPWVDDEITSYSQRIFDYGFKFTVHEVCGRGGFVLHLAVCTMHGFPLTGQFETTNNNTQTIHQTLMSNLSGAFIASDLSKQDLSDVVLASDRGYMTTAGINDVVVVAGAQCVGTAKRTRSFPVTYD